MRTGQRVLDVGCGPGALTAELVARVGPSAVAAVDPSAPFVAAARERNPGVEVVQASAERLPFPALTFDAVVAQLVVHFMPDPNKGLAEMARVTRRDGVVAACVWTTPAVKARSACSGAQRGGSTRTSRTNPSFRVSARVTWLNCSRRLGCTRSSKQSFG